MTDGSSFTGFVFAVEDGEIRQWKFQPGQRCQVANLSFEGEMGILQTPRDQFGVIRIENQVSGDTMVIRGLTKEGGFPVYQLKLLKVKKREVAVESAQQERELVEHLILVSGEVLRRVASDGDQDAAIDGKLPGQSSEKLETGLVVGMGLSRLGDLREPLQRRIVQLELVETRGEGGQI